MHCFARPGVLQCQVAVHVLHNTSGRCPCVKRWLFSGDAARRLADTHVSRLIGEIMAPQQPLLQVVAASQLCRTTVLSRSPRRMAEAEDKRALSWTAPDLDDHCARLVSPKLSLLPEHGCCRHCSRYRVARNSSMPRVIVLLRRLESLRCRYQQHIQRYHRLEQNAYDTQKHTSGRGG